MRPVPGELVVRQRRQMVSPAALVRSSVFVNSLRFLGLPPPAPIPYPNWFGIRSVSVTLPFGDRKTYYLSCTPVYAVSYVSGTTKRH